MNSLLVNFDVGDVLAGSDPVGMERPGPAALALIAGRVRVLNIGWTVRLACIDPARSSLDRVSGLARRRCRIGANRAGREHVTDEAVRAARLLERVALLLECA